MALKGETSVVGDELTALVPGLSAWLLAEELPSGATFVPAVAFRSPKLVREAVVRVAAGRVGLQRAALRWGAAYAAALTAVPLAAATAGVAVDVTPEALELIVAEEKPLGARQQAGAFLAIYPPRLPVGMPSGLLSLARQQDLFWLVHGRLIRRHLAPVFALLHTIFWVPRSALWRQLHTCCVAAFEAASAHPALALAAQEDRQMVLTTRTSTLLGNPNPLYLAR